MLLALLVASVLADVPPPFEPDLVVDPADVPVVQEPTAGLTAELLVPSAAEGKVAAGEPVGLVLSFHNQGDQAVSHAVNAKTVHVRDHRGDASKDLDITWSLGSVSLEPGALAAAFARVALGAGEHELKLWWTPDGGEPTGEPMSVLELTAE